MRSVVVVFPASMCAMMPMLRNFESSVAFISPTGSRERSRSSSLPTVMGERLVRVGHTMRVLALLDGVAAAACGIHQLVREPLAHRLLAARPGVVHEPANRERLTAHLADLDRHLIRRSADAAALDLDARLDVLHGLLEDLEWIVARALVDLVKGAVEDAPRQIGTASG